ncbi:hypothetical protein R50073_16510 [Maricurvus nonylphenolicus]|uniref:DoxX-like family protein n=1 Tax=Maricurvus nonylphenolicus TaxID=1008307 RepID=UPI0036F3FAC5
MNIQTAARLSISFLWVFTGVTSYFFAKDIGYDVLARAEITGAFAEVCIVAGCVLDILIGLWLLTGRKLLWCYWLQFGVIAVYTLLLTVIAPDFWLHPFGPLTKNLPLVVLIYWLYSCEVAGEGS